MEARERVIFPLDGMTVDDATAWVERLRGRVGIAKVGLQIFTRYGPLVVRAVQMNGLPVMLDLKLNDIPATMANATEMAIDLGVKWVTIHASAGQDAIKACVKATEGTKTSVVAVTVLTSLGDRGAARIFGTFPEKDAARIAVTKLTLEAIEGGASHFVCSPREASLIRSLKSNSTIITPGIRLPSSDLDDQKRIGTPEEAIKQGADYLVVGRPIRNAYDPGLVIGEICQGIERGLASRK